MNETSTINEKLILYLFNETELLDSVIVQQAIDNDPETECEFENLKASLGLMDRVLTDPSPVTVRRIMDFATSGLS